MQINVAQLLKDPIGSVRELHVDTPVNIESCDSPVRGKARLIRTDRGILATATLTADIRNSCSRCLSPFDSTLSLEIEEEYFPTLDINTGTALPSPEEPGSFTIDEHNILDLTEAIRQYALTAVPMKPLCQEDCAGLCPTCGVNLNESTCSCPSRPVDPRWSVLSKLAPSDADTPAEN